MPLSPINKSEIHKSELVQTLVGDHLLSVAEVRTCIDRKIELRFSDGAGLGFAMTFDPKDAREIVALLSGIIAKEKA